MYRLIYVSRSTKPMTNDDLKAIERSAVRFNSGVDITGALFFGKGRFLQVLEGKEKTVEALYQHLHEDPRHTDLVCISRASTNVRLFQNWNMGVFNLETENAAIDVERLADLANAATLNDNTEKAYLDIVEFIEDFRQQVCSV